jgi:hypothetical protein
VQKEEKIMRNLQSAQDYILVCIVFLGSSSLCRAACRAVVLCNTRVCRTRSASPRLRMLGRVCLIFSIPIAGLSIAKRVFRVRAARRSGKAELK